MADAHVDADIETVKWFAGHGPVEIIGPCTHDCNHNWTMVVIAWGPDYEHYTLNECSVCKCRGWSSEWPDGRSKQRQLMAVRRG